MYMYVVIVVIVVDPLSFKHSPKGCRLSYKKEWKGWCEVDDQKERGKKRKKKEITQDLELDKGKKVG